MPVGFLLSGGLDSTAMLGFAVGKTDRPLSSFTIGFSHPGVTDERPYARIAAQKYGVEQHEMTISADDFASFLPNYIWYMEEPICEPPAVALYYISKLARDFVKVLISGEGGDEAFAGYPNYRNMLWLERLKAAAGPFDGALAAGLKLAGRLLRSEHANRYGQLMGTPFENYYYSRTSSPFRYFNRQADQLYTQDFAASVDKNRSLGVVRRLLENSANIGIHGDRVNQMLYVLSLIHILPSIEEGSALVTAEARGSGCVLLVSDAAGAICKHRENALVHRVGDVSALTRHIDLLHQDRALMARLRSASLSTASEITWTAAGKVLLDVYRETIEMYPTEVDAQPRSAHDAVEASVS